MDIKTLAKENEELRKQIGELEERLKKYTAPSRNKRYYQKHKEEIIAHVKDNPPSAEKQREYNKRYYERKKKEKKEKEDKNDD